MTGQKMIEWLKLQHLEDVGAPGVGDSTVLTIWHNGSIVDNILIAVLPQLLVLHTSHVSET